MDEPAREHERATVVWSRCVPLLRGQVSEATWNTCFADLRGGSVEGRAFHLLAPNSLVKERLESRFAGLLQTTASDVLGDEIEIIIDLDHRDPPADRAPGEGTAPSPLPGSPHTSPVGPDPAHQADPGLSRGEPHAGSRPPATARARDNGAVPPARGVEQDGPLLNARYTFEDFVIGQSNRFAHAAAMSVAETPARSYNPLFIYGDSGLGKTHLLQAIAHYVAQNYRNQRVRYVSTETFVNEFVDSIRNNTSAAFKRRYRDDCDVLLIDDIQFMEGKEATQEEFFHTFNFLHQSGRQVVISSDRPPKAIATLEDRLRSRFEWGLITDIQPPELETRLAIVRKKAERERTEVPGPVLEFIATHVKDNIRELEGALNRVVAYAGLNRVALDLPLAERVLGDLLSGNEPRPVTPKVILRHTAEMFGFGIEELTGQSRRRPLVTARQIGMYVFRELTDFSYPMIGREFGNRDHTTVMHAVEKIAEQMKERRAIYEQVTELIKIIKSGG